MKNNMNQKKIDIFERMNIGGLIPFSDSEYLKKFEGTSKTINLSIAHNTSTNVDKIRERLSEIVGQQIDKSTTIFTPFHTNFGRRI